MSHLVGKKTNNLDIQINGSAVFDVDDYIKQLEKEVVNEKAGILSLNKKGIKKMVDYNLIKQKMKTKWEDIIYDCEGRMVMKCYQKRK